MYNECTVYWLIAKPRRCPVFWSEAGPAAAPYFGQMPGPPLPHILVRLLIKNVGPQTTPYFGQIYWWGRHTYKCQIKILTSIPGNF